ncbi:MAG: hypothetical protein JWR32_2639 [Mycobacterium sp.]|nr:hypothetical protein [Mycobacterium sp.]
MQERAVFQKGELSDFLVQRQTAAAQALQDVPEDEFLADPADAVARIYQNYMLDDVTVAGRDQVVSEGTRPVKLRARDHFDGREYKYEGMRVSIRIQFTGPGEVWHYRPSQSFIGAYGNVQLHTDHFMFIGEARTPTSEQVLAALDQAISELQRSAEWINTDLSGWRSGLQTLLETIARERRENLAGMSALDEALGIPIRSAAAERQIPIQVRPKPLRPRPERGASTRAPAAQRVLANDVYEDVVRTIEQMTHAMERTPTTAKLGEEELRNLILIVLNANYEGAARGEVFNGRGKTDILLTWEGDNAFIAECKVWKGAAGVRRAIDQLLEYVTWRDTKAALVLFIKSGKPSEILAKAQAEIESHAAHVQTRPTAADTRRDFALKAPTDEQRRISLALVPVVLISDVGKTTR